MFPAVLAELMLLSMYVGHTRPPLLGGYGVGIEK